MSFPQNALVKCRRCSFDDVIEVSHIWHCPECSVFLAWNFDMSKCPADNADHVQLMYKKGDPLCTQIKFRGESSKKFLQRFHPDLEREGYKAVAWKPIELPSVETVEKLLEERASC